MSDSCCPVLLCHSHVWVGRQAMCLKSKVDESVDE